MIDTHEANAPAGSDQLRGAIDGRERDAVGVLLAGRAGRTAHQFELCSKVARGGFDAGRCVVPEEIRPAGDEHQFRLFQFGRAAVILKTAGLRRERHARQSERHGRIRLHGGG